VNRVEDRRQTPLEKLVPVVRLNGEAEQVWEGQSTYNHNALDTRWTAAVKRVEFMFY
jgi:hypothetical protein